MKDANQKAHLDRIRVAVAEVQRLVLTPSPASLDACQPWLTQIRVGLETLQTRASHGSCFGSKVMPAELTRIRQDIARIGLLLDNADGFYVGWQRLRACLTAGYTAQGVPAQFPADQRVSLEG
jgi:hypothetical protein